MGNQRDEVEAIERIDPFTLLEKMAQAELQTETAKKTHAAETHALEVESVPPLSPPLPPPSESFQGRPPPLPPPESFLSRHLRVIAQNIEQTGLKKKEIEEEWLAFISHELSELSHEAMEHIKESAEKHSRQSAWSILRKIGEAILAAISVIFGLSLVATGAGAVVGGLLIASGVLAIVNLVCVETKLWDKFAEAVAGDNKKLRQQLRVWVPGAIALVSAVVGAVGSGGALLFSSLNLVHKGIMIANSAVQVAQGITTIGEGVARSENIRFQADRDELQTRIDLTEADLRRSVKNLEKQMEFVSRNFYHAWRSLEAISRTSEQILIRG